MDLFFSEVTLMNGENLMDAKQQTLNNSFSLNTLCYRICFLWKHMEYVFVKANSISSLSLIHFV